MRVQKTLQDAEHALLVIQTAGGDELLIAAPDGGLFADAEEQVTAKDLLFCDLQLGGDQLFQHAFLGGTGGQVREILQLLLEKNPHVRIVATAVTLESVAELTECVKAFPFRETEAVSLTAARSRKAGAYHLMTGQNPVYIFTMQG